MENQLLTFILSLVASAIVGFFAAYFKIGKYQEKVDNLNIEKEKSQKKIDGLRSDVDKLLEFKSNTQKYVDSKIYKSGSPLELTDIGKRLVRESGFIAIFEEQKDDLVILLEEKYNPRTQYDVQEKSRELMENLRDHAPFQSIKKYAFDNGKDFAQILRAGAIPLRDYYFEKHPEIDN